jgi:hypothetical protein
VLLYLSAYAAFGYYHLVPQKAAFVFWHLDRGSCGVGVLCKHPQSRSLVGGFLTPSCIRIAIITCTLWLPYSARHWGPRGSKTLARLAHHLSKDAHTLLALVQQHYHEQRLVPVLLFQTAVFLIFLAAHLVTRLLRRSTRP